ncbi:hypothetical protein QUF80_07810 [Desulfococcaceae bacterium HSG8]|nr:hypothetical protein [Desulfococcaceae bacterium HSG8]
MADIASKIDASNPDRITHKYAEQVAGHDGRIRDALGRKYSKTYDMPEMVKHLPFEGDVLKFVPSYEKFLKFVKELVNEARKGAAPSLSKL